MQISQFTQKCEYHPKVISLGVGELYVKAVRVSMSKVNVDRVYLAWSACVLDCVCVVFVYHFRHLWELAGNLLQM